MKEENKNEENKKKTRVLMGQDGDNGRGGVKGGSGCKGWGKRESFTRG